MRRTPCDGTSSLNLPPPMLSPRGCAMRMAGAPVSGHLIRRSKLTRSVFNALTAVFFSSRSPTLSPENRSNTAAISWPAITRNSSMRGLILETVAARPPEGSSFIALMFRISSRMRASGGSRVSLPSGGELWSRRAPMAWAKPVQESALLLEKRISKMAHYRRFAIVYFI